MRRRRPLLFLGRDTTPEVTRPDEFARPDPERLSTLEWRQEGRWYKPAWSLWCDGARVASLTPEGFTGSNAILLTRDGEWRVRRHGWVGGYELRKPDAEEPLARYKPGFFGRGPIERPGLPTLHWRAGFFGRECRIVNDEDFVYFATQARHSLFREQAEVRVEQAGRALPDLLPLIALAWWLALARARQSHAH